MTHALDIPYISQVDGPGAGNFRNDCGPACVAMFVHGRGQTTTVAEVYHATGVRADQYISGGQLIRAAAKWNIALQGAYLSLEQAKLHIEGGNPIIALVHYGTFSKLGKTEYDFRGPHFLNIVGVTDDKIIVHDPLWSGRGGEYLSWSKQFFYQSWHDARLDGNSPFYGLVCNERYRLRDHDPSVDPPPQPPKPDVWGTGIVVARALYLRHHPGGRVITALRQGTTVDVLEPKRDGWYHVRWGNVEGWCGGNPRYIVVNKAPQVDPPMPEPDPEAVQFMDAPESKRWSLVQQHLIDQGVLGKDGYILEG